MENLDPTQIEALHNKNGITGLIYNYSMACFNIVKFLRSVYKTDDEPKVRVAPAPRKKRPDTATIDSARKPKMASAQGKDLCVNQIVASKKNNFKLKLHSQMYNENLQKGFDNLKKENQIKDTEKRIKELKRLKSQMQWKEKRVTKLRKQKKDKSDAAEYLAYKEDLRKMSLSIIEEKIREDKNYKIERDQEKIQDIKAEKMRKEIKAKLLQLDEFKKTIEEKEWKDLQESEKKKELKARMIEEFTQKLEEEKVFKQLLYAAEKKIEHEERIRRREENLKHKHNTLLNEEMELAKELEMLQEMYDDSI